VSNDVRRLRRAAGLAARFGRIDVVAIESTAAYASGLVRYLREHDIRVLEVNQPHAHTRRRRSKSDPIDAARNPRRRLSDQTALTRQLALLAPDRRQAVAPHAEALAGALMRNPKSATPLTRHNHRSALNGL